MKSFTLFLVLLFVGLISCQITERNNLYNEINRVRSTYCLSPITIDAQLQAATDSIVNARCNNQGFTVPPNTMNLNYNWMGSWTYTDFYNTVKSVYDTSRNSWTCQGDVSLGDTNFIRLSLVPTQSMACSFSSLCGGRYFFQCLFRVAPSFPVLSQCTCGGTTTTTAPSTTGTSTTGTTTTNNGGTTTTVTIDANGNTVTTVTDANGNRWVTVTAPTTAPVNNSPVTTAPATTAPVTSAPATTAPVNNSPTTTAPSTTISADSVKNGHMTPINNARSCLGVPLLTWDDSLARNAQAWADALAPTCGSNHAFSTTNPPRNEQEEGENIWQYWADNLDQAITYGTNFWNGEAAYYDCASNTCQSGRTCGHYTQDISSHSTRMGCAVVRCPSSFDSFGKGKYTGVCRFGKPGNNGQHPLAIAGSCNNFPTCKANLASNRALATDSTTKTTSTQPTSTSSFFSSDSQVVVFALAIIIVVLVCAILFILLVSNKKHSTNNRDLEFKLLESK